MSYQVQVNGDWGGASRAGWWPAITGTLNQTATPDHEASTFETYEAAEAALHGPIADALGDPLTECVGEGLWASVSYGDTEVAGPIFRIVET